MTRALFDLPLKGLGAPYVESFCSYINRSALAHGVSPNQLVRAVVNTDKSGQLNGYSEYAHKVAAAFCRFTGRRELLQSTLLRFRGVLAPNCADSVTTYRRWCPRCIASDIERGEPGYDPLIWSIEAISLCPIHDFWLVERCAYCYSHQPCLSSASRVHCKSCKQPLSAGHDVEEPSALECNVRANLAQLLPHGDRSAFQEDAMKSFIIACIGTNNWSFSEAAERLTSNQYSLEKLTLDRPHRPTLFTALQIAGACQQSLELILEDPIASAAQIRFDFDPPEYKKQEHPRITADVRTGVVDTLLRVSRDRHGGCPPSVRAICAAYGVTAGFANYAFPSLVERISLKRKEFFAKRARQREEAAKSAVSRWLDGSGNMQSSQISRKFVVAQLKKETGLPKRILASALAAQIDTIRASSPRH